jgi:transposase
MTKVECPECHQKLESDVFRCPHCGYLAGLNMEI